MKTLGLLGGLSWESTLEYYRLLNEGVKARLGGLHSVKCLIYSVDFAPMEKLQAEEKWPLIAQELSAAAQKLEKAGAEGLLICSNTSHRVADEVAAAIGIPLIHIADALAKALINDRRRSLAFLGTQYTMEQPFYRARIEKAGLEMRVPEAAERRKLHGIIYDELCHGTLRPESKTFVLGLLESFRKAGAEAAVLGCTELGLLVQPNDTAVPLYDTMKIHTEAALDYALAAE